MSSAAKSWSLLILLSLIWGSSFILMKRGLDAFSSQEVAAIRISMAFLFLSPLLFKYYQLDFKKYGLGIFIMGVFGNFLPAFLFTAAETQISSSLTGMLNALTPLFTIVIGFLWLKSKPGAAKISGIITGLVAAIALTYYDTNNSPSKNIVYGLLVVAATICYAISINGIKRYLGGLHPVMATVWAFTFIGPVSIAYLFGATDFLPHLQQNPLGYQSLGYLSILAIVGTALSVMLYNILIREAGAVFASTCTYLIPVVAIAWGLVDYELISWQQVLSMAVIILSVYLINRK